MSGLGKEIVDWFHGQRDWLQDAGERILKLGTLDDVQIDELAARLKTPDGNQITLSRAFVGVAGASSATSDLRLDSIGNVTGIDNLSPRNPLQFGSGNLTVIYGHNGAGKSSYSRILKKVSGKPRADDLKPNVFQPVPQNRQCQIVYTLAGSAPTTATWTANSNSVQALEPIDIFDGDAATFYLSGESQVSYTPQEVALFEELVRTCNRIKAKLQEEQNHLVCKLPELPANFTKTVAAKAYQSLAATTTEQTLTSLLHWAEEDDTRVEQLEERLKTADPNKLATDKRNRKARLDIIASTLEKLSCSLSPEACSQISGQHVSAVNSRRQATEAAAANTQSAQLDGIGTDTWNAMWSAAREYSASRAYPAQPFPVTDGDARCVLCQQPLDADAKQRLNDFEAFVQGKMEAAAKAAESVFQQSLKDLPEVHSDDWAQTQLQAAGLTDESLYQLLCEFLHSCKHVTERIRSAEFEDNQLGVTQPDGLIGELKAAALVLEQEAIQHDADAKVFDRNKAIQDKLELDARRWTSQQETAIREEVERQKVSKQFDDWKRLTETRPISLKAGEISQKAITDDYVARFNAELNQLGATKIKVELKRTRVEKGVPKHQILLKGASAARIAANSVLSDGERRIVALAAFLADVTGKPYTAPFVFDDPISSLDIDFEWHVAKRLAELAIDRQVIVMTHRLSLFGTMDDAAKKVGAKWRDKHLKQVCIESFAGTSGHPVDQSVSTGNTTKANNKLLNERLVEAKRHWDAGDSPQYRVVAQAICSDFRKLLERTVEDDLLNHVVKRHRRSITTDNRLVELPKIVPEDCRLIDELMTKYSCYEHSQSSETPVFLPDEPELRKDLELLRDWRNDFASRPAPA